MTDRAELQRVIAAMDDPKKNGDGCIVSRRLSEFEPEDVTWLWPGRLPVGKLVWLDGDPSTGKSHLCLDWCARLTIGRTWPDDASGFPGTVAYLTAEDGIADTIRRRFDAMDGDPSRFFLFTVKESDGHERDVSVPQDLQRLQAVIVENDIRLLVLDPFTAYLGGEFDTYRDHDIRRALKQLARLAEETRCTILCIRHLNKQGGGKAIYRGGASIAFTAAARVVLLASEDPTDESRRVLAVIKCNVAAKAVSLAYQITDAPEGSSRVEWKGSVDVSADELVTAITAEERSQIEEAKDVIDDALADGKRPEEEVWKKVRAAGISKRTYRRARESLGLTQRAGGAFREGFGPGGRWWLQFPETHRVPNNFIDCQTNARHSMVDRGTLWAERDGNRQHEQDERAGMREF